MKNEFVREFCSAFSTVLRIRIRDPVHFWPLDPVSGIRNRFFPDPGSQIPDPGSQTHIFESLVTIFLVKSYIILWKYKKNFLQHFKAKIMISFVKFSATKKGMTTNFFSPLSFVAVLGSGIRDPGSGTGKNQDPVSGINIPDPQHCFCTNAMNRYRTVVTVQYPSILYDECEFEWKLMSNPDFCQTRQNNNSTSVVKNIYFSF